MTLKNRDRMIRMGLAALASGLGYAYHALSQERSVASKVREDTYRMRNSLQSHQTAQAVTEQLDQRVTQYKQTSDLLLCPYADEVVTETYDAGEMHWLNWEIRETSPKILVYFHGGMRLDHIQPAEWQLLKRLAQKMDLPIAVIPIHPLSVRTFAMEVEQTYRLMHALKQHDKTKRFYALSYDSGAMLALELADADPQLFERLILTSPWLGQSHSCFDVLPKDYYTNKDELAAIEDMWQVNDPGVDMTQMPIDHLPEVVFISGSYDSLKNQAFRLYKRLVAQQKPTKYYQFDYMVHDFLLTSIAEAKEACDIILENLEFER